MLLQSQSGLIRLLPALPSGWPDGAVSGLRARGGFTVDMAWSKGALTRATLRSDRAQPCALRYGAQALTIKDATGKLIAAQRQEGGWRFAAEPGVLYSLEPAH